VPVKGFKPSDRSAARGANQRVARWFELRSPIWQDLGAKLEEVDRGKTASRETVQAMIGSYPEIARDLAIARREAPTGSLTRHLELIYLELHRTIFRPPGSIGRDIADLFLHGAAAEAARLRWHIFWVVTLFVASALAGWALVSTYPELAALFASNTMIDQVSRGELWTDGIHNVVPSSLMSVRLFTNNITVSLMAVCLGVLFGLGTIYIIGLNGLMLGGVFAFTNNYGMADRLFEWTAAHGFVELSVICVAGAVGASLGEALARPGHLTRLAAFQLATRRGFRLMVVALTFLVGAGVIEGNVSPNPDFGLAGRLVVGLGYWLVFFLVLSGALGRMFDRAHRRAS
jgi:uncharacterized membrane protein SpoIIM required for sporulation